MKKLFALLLALVMVLSAVPAMADLAKVEPIEGERPTITFGRNMDQEAIDEHVALVAWQQLEDTINVNIEIHGFVDDQGFQLALAGGDMGDINQIDRKYLTQMINAGIVQDLGQYADKLPNFNADLFKVRNAAIKEYFSDGTGMQYFWTPHVGNEAQELYEWNGVNVRWDWYKEVGAPHIAGDEDWVEVMKAIVELHPTNEAGQKVYGYGAWNDLWAYYIPGGGTYGFHNITEAYHLRAKDSMVINGFVDPEGPTWKMITFANKVHQAGLFDPDSFTMTGDDFTAKVANEQFVTIPCQWYDGLYGLKKQEDPNTLAGYVAIPVEGAGIWSGSNYRCGWNFFYGLDVNCENTDAALKFIDYMHTEDFARLCDTGAYGLVWEYDADGNPVLTEEAIKNKAEMTGDDFKAWGGTLWNGYPGMGQFNVLSDGGMSNLWNSKEMQLKNARPLDLDFAAHYGVERPSDAIYNMIAEGKAFNKANTLADLGNMMPAVPTEISRIDNACKDIVYRNLPDVVLAENNEAFQAEFDRIQAELVEAGVEESINWWSTESEKVRNFLLNALAE